VLSTVSCKEGVWYRPVRYNTVVLPNAQVKSVISSLDRMKMYDEVKTMFGNFVIFDDQRVQTEPVLKNASPSNCNACCGCRGS
jgi:hypothetical protein